MIKEQKYDFSLEDLFSSNEKNLDDILEREEFNKKNPELNDELKQKTEYIQKFLSGEIDKDVQFVTTLQKIYKKMLIANTTNFSFLLTEGNLLEKSILEIVRKNKNSSIVDIKKYNFINKFKNIIEEKIKIRKSLEKTELEIKKSKRNGLMFCIGALLTCLIPHMTFLVPFTLLGLLSLNSYFCYVKQQKEIKNLINQYTEKEELFIKDMDTSFEDMGIKSFSKFKYKSQKYFANKAEKVKFIRSSLDGNDFFEKIFLGNLFSEGEMKKFLEGSMKHDENQKEIAKKILNNDIDNILSLIKDKG